MSRGLFAPLVLVAAVCFGAVAHAAEQWKPFAGDGGHLFPSLIISTATMKPQQAASVAGAAAQHEGGIDVFEAAEEQFVATLLHAILEHDGDEQEQQSPAAPNGSGANEDEQLHALGDPLGMAGVHIVSPRAGATVRVTIEAPGFLSPSTFEGTLDEAGAEYEVVPKAAWNYDALARVRQQQPLAVVFKVSIDGAAEQTQTQTVTLRTINDCPFYLPDDGHGGGPVSLALMFAAYVNENHPWIDALKREAIDAGVVTQFVGRQQGAEEAERQVFAIWHMLQRRGFTYSDISAVPARSDQVASQHVRLFEDSIETSQGNCVDGTVLMASILAKIGIEPYLVLKPGHMFLAFNIGSAQQPQVLGLETTVMGSADLRSVEDPVQALEQSGASWEQARKSGDEQLQQVAQAMQANPDDTQYAIISLDFARRLGIMPLPYKGDESRE